MAASQLGSDSRSRSGEDWSSSFPSSPGSSPDSSSPTTPESCSPRLTAKLQTGQNVHQTLLDASSSSDFASLPPVPKTELIQPLASDSLTPDHWVARDSRMIRLTGKHPCNVEAPLSALFNAGFLTPQNLFYVRSHGDTPRISAKQAHGWKLRVHGLVENEFEFTIQELKEKFPVVTLPVTLVCAGNRRKEQNMVVKGLGFNWGAAGVSTGLFTGVYLADILDYCKPQNPLLSAYPSYDKPVPGRARHVIFEGADELPKGKYGTSQRLSWALDRGKGMLISWGLNGEDLSPDHGYPLRLVVPGQIGGRMVKWLQRIEVSDRESQHYLHFFDNKLLPTMVTADQARNEDKWWYDPKYIINELNVNAAICSPAHDDIIQLASGTSTARNVAIEGYAYTGGGRRITRVEVTLDDGQTWKLCDIKYPEDLYRMYPIENHPYFGNLDLTTTDMSFSWCFWKVEVDVKSLLADQDAGFVAVRAMDEALSIMPRDMYWNATSMMNSWWFRVAIYRENSGQTLRFEHPTVPGNASGGWMQRINEAGADPRFPNLGENNLSSASITTDAHRPQGSLTGEDFQGSMINPDKAETVVAASQLAEHADGEGPSPWFVVEGHVYDGTAFLLSHPGGEQSIRLAAGEDATEDFMAIHSMDAKKMLRDYHIGKLEHLKAALTPPMAKSENQDDPSKPFLEPRMWKEVQLIHKREISHNSRIFRFALPHQDQCLGLPVGQHIYLRIKKVDQATGKVEIVQRAYTPYSCSTQRGFVDLLIKVYFPSDKSSQGTVSFSGGQMTMLLENMAMVAKTHQLTLELKGPIGHFTYVGNSQVQWKPNNRLRMVRRFAMIAGGSGITPIWSTLKAIADEYSVPSSSQDKSVGIWLIYGNRQEDDILIREELDHLSRCMNGNLHIWHVLSSDELNADWKMGRGHIGLECLQQHLPPAPCAPTGTELEDTLALVCGPPAMEASVSAGLQRLGWSVKKNVVFF
ncbi:nitrate reductase [Trichoderma novae-zelandiae]